MKNDLITSINKCPAQWKQPSRIYGEACEYWVESNIKCPKCDGTLDKQQANEKSIDHRCSSCKEEYQTKASKTKIIKSDGSIRLLGAEYKTTLSKVGCWGLICVEYCPDSNKVLNHKVISKEKITEDCIVPRKPLGPSARRAGWQGCYINIPA